MPFSQSWARWWRTWPPARTQNKVSLKRIFIKRIFSWQMKPQKAPRLLRLWEKSATRSVYSRSMQAVCRPRSIKASLSLCSSLRTVPRPQLRHLPLKRSWPWPYQTTTAKVFRPPSSAGNNVPHLTRLCPAALILRTPKTWLSARTWSACWVGPTLKARLSLLK